MPKRIHCHLIRLYTGSWLVPSEATYREGEIGTEILVTIYTVDFRSDGAYAEPMDLTGKTVEILLHGSSGMVTKIGELVGPATDGTVKVITAAGDLVRGRLRIQAKAVVTSHDEIIFQTITGSVSLYIAQTIPPNRE